ncbi:MAG: hypothetical protein R2932_16650 [Caldilineaceae bacterium]
MYNYQGSDADNENTGTAQIFVDLRNGTTSGSFLVMRNVDPDLVSWVEAPFGTRIFDGPNTVTNHAALTDFGDELPGVLTLIWSRSPMAVVSLKRLHKQWQAMVASFS